MTRTLYYQQIINCSSVFQECYEYGIINKAEVYDRKPSGPLLIVEPLKCVGIVTSVELYAFETGGFVLILHIHTSTYRHLHTHIHTQKKMYIHNLESRNDIHNFCLERVF